MAIENSAGTELSEAEEASRGRPWWRPMVLRDFSEIHRASTWLELLSDLCFVVAIAALARELHGDPTLRGILRFLGLFVPVWWAWMGFTWFATGFDNDDVPYRLSMLGAMLCVLWLAASLPAVTGGNSAGFVLAYVTLRLLLVGLFVRARRQAAGVLWSFTTRYTVGNSLGVAIWLASLLLPPPVRYAAWALGLLADIGTPILATRWTSIQALQVYHPAHIKERYGLFTLIVLGESVVAVAAGTAGTGWQRASVLTGICGFVVAACIWWIYFDHVEATALGLGRAASFYWGYGHLLVYAGIAAVGVGIEFAIEGAAGAGDHAVWTDGTRAILAGGAAVYLLAISFIRFVTRHDLRDSALVARLVMAAALLGLAALGSPLGPLAFAAVLACALLALTLFEGGRS